MPGEEAPALRQGHGMREDAIDLADGRPEMAIRLWRMRSSVSRSTTTSWVSSRSKCSETEPASEFSMGMAAASTDPLATAAKASAESEKGTMTASATSFMAASWLNEPGSP
jgi:hypothetical protein